MPVAAERPRGHPFVGPAGQLLDRALARPVAIVCLGATAAQTLLGRSFRVTQRRGEFLESTIAPYVMATVHPSAILRAPDEGSRHQQERQFLADLKKIAAIRE